MIEIVVFSITIIVAIGYVTMIAGILKSWDNISEWIIPFGFNPKIKVSVVIAARNESTTIVDCLESILHAKYPDNLLEIIVIDDQSTDDTAKIVSAFQQRGVKLIKLESNIGKKRALSLGIKSANGTLIMCTDADCIVPSTWFQEIVSYYQYSKARLIASPIKYHCNKTIIQRFQFLDSINNMCVTGSGIQTRKFHLANGANLAFEKSLFQEIGGFSSNLNLASGDDVFMIQATAKKYPKKIRFLKSKAATVLTSPELTWKDLSQQRKRWATKSKHYNTRHINLIQGYVFCFSILLLLNLIYTPFGSGLSLFGFLFGLFIKLVIDYLYLDRLCQFFENTSPLKSFFTTSFIFLLYIIIAGYWAIFPSKYIWKGRHVE